MARHPSKVARPMFILLPLLFIWSRAPMKYGFMSKTVILAGFVLAVVVISAEYQVPALVHPAQAADSWDEELNEEDDPRPDLSRPRLREGTKLASVIGRFTRVGRRWVLELEPPTVESESSKSDSLGRNKSKSSKDVKSADVDATASQPVRASAVPVEPIRYRVLENLTLQRVADAIAQDPNDVRWIASGTITEFDGENWLLLSTVFRAHSAAEPVDSL